MCNSDTPGQSITSDRPDAFICYSRKDRRFVQDTLCARLLEHGKEIWVDLEDIPPAADWRDKVFRGIESAKAFVFVLSPESVRSPVCDDERRHAVALNRRLIPVLHRDPKRGTVPEELERTNWILLREEDDHERGFALLLEALETDLAWRDAHARLGVRTREWLVGDRDGSFLLRGRDLDAAQDWLAEQGSHAERATQEEMEFVAASQRTARRRQRLMLSVAVVGLIIALGLSAYALRQRSTAIERAEIATSRELASSSVAQLQADPELSLLLATEAARAGHTAQAATALRLALAQPRLRATLRPRGGAVTDLQFSPDGRYLATASADRRARVWNWQRGRQLAVLGPHRHPCPPSDAIGVTPCLIGDDPLRLAFGPKGLVATNGDDGRVLLWNWRTERSLRRLGGGGSGGSVVFDPTGAHVLANGARGATVWERRTGERVTRLGDPEVPPDARFSPDGRLVATWDDEGVQVWSWPGERLRATLPSSDSVFAGIEDVDFSPDGTHLVAADAAGDAAVWNWRRQRRTQVFRAHGDAAVAARFSAHGDLLLTAGGDGTARVWAWRSGTGQASLRVHRGPLTSAAFHPRKALAATGGADGTARVWGQLAQRPGFRVVTPTELATAALSPDGRRVLTAASEEGPTATVWDASTGDQVARLPDRGDGFVVSASGIDTRPTFGADFSDDGGLVVATSHSRDVAALVWAWKRDAPPVALRTVGRRRTRARTLRLRFTSPVAATEISPDGRFVFTSQRSGAESVWDWRFRRIVRQLPARRGEPAGGSFSPDGDLIATTTKAGIVRVWDWRARDLLRQLHAPGAQTVAFRRDGNLLVTSGRTPRVWDWRSGRPIADIRTPGMASAASFNPRGDLVLTVGTDGPTRIWDWQAEQEVLNFGERRGLVTDARFAPGGRRVITAGGDGAARVYACDICGSLDELLRLAEERVTRPLSGGERRRYLHEG